MHPTSKRISCQQANQLDLVQYLSQLGFEPAKISAAQYWYHSPLRTERTPSFKVDRGLNLWYDHGLGKGGTFIDFALLYHNIPLPQLLQNLSALVPLTFHPYPSTIDPVVETQKTIAIEAESVLSSSTLVRYLKQRGIDRSIAEVPTAPLVLKTTAGAMN